MDKNIEVSKASSGDPAVNVFISYTGQGKPRTMMTLTHEQLQAIIDMASLETGFDPKPKLHSHAYPGPEPKPKPKTPKGPQAYKGNGKQNWETVTNDLMFSTYRLRVPGGWLYAEGAGDPVYVPMPDAVGYSI